VVVKRRRRRIKERVIRLYRLSSTPANAAAAAADSRRRDGETRRTSFTSDSPAHQPTAAAQAAGSDTGCSMQAEFHTGVASVELSDGLAAVEHELNEIPDDCLRVIRSTQPPVPSGLALSQLARLSGASSAKCEVCYGLLYVIIMFQSENYLSWALPSLPYLTSGVGRLLHLLSAEAVSVRANARPRM